ncbi:peptide deformylase [Aliikangiella coralliicola]|uniref:Peptide deformylase n=1 Tax=Aliikangiella coralliicola TaxID=2592383 RepID=A0A545UBM8_9GAMM|nr:peptide deformylase [Aliikangiella coralliicola]TQV86875.1 peptide deformylase [Aliikangiella coralliicola]
MAIRQILRMGDPRLLQSSQPVTEFGSPFLQALVEDMVDTMNSVNGAGLAAPQIGFLQQVVIFGGGENPRYPDAEAVPFTVLINPTIKILSDSESSYWEGCLSIPGMRGLVSRPSHIEYSGFDQNGAPIVREAEGFHATVVQHECDHLQGILYPMKIKGMSQFGFEEELAHHLESIPVQ